MNDFTFEEQNFTTGVDIIEISRIEHSMRNPRFSARVFGKNELSFLKSAESFAGNFCAKEAFAKALGTGVRNFKLNEVQVLRDKLGRPYFYLSGNAKILSEKAKLNFSVSISHTKSIATAFVIGYKI